MEKSAYEKGVDRISQLPESVISEILSRLPIEDAIDTCFLSRSWRHRWKDLQVFNFSVIPFKNQKGFLDEQGHMRFFSLVNDILLHHRRAPVRKLRIRYVTSSVMDLDYAALKAWVYAAIGSHLEELKLKSSAGWKLMLPSRLFTCCTSLVNLELAACQIDAEELTQVRFPSLKNLKLVFHNPKLITNILSGSPVLETLDLRVATKLGVFKIHSPSLKRLYYFDSCSSRTELLEINTPLLEYLTIRIYRKYRLISVCNSHNLLEANLDCYADANYDSYVAKLINSLCNVKSLVLHPYTRYCLVEATQFDLPEFRYLLNLEFVNMNFDARFLFRMLERCPMLQVLTVHSQSPLRASRLEWTQPTNVPYCLASQLSIVNFKTYNGIKADQELIAYILQQGLALKSISIGFAYISINSEQGHRMINELWDLPKSSKMCQVYFNSYQDSIYGDT
ncbi:hypothetical protein PIB30_049066 [Stylosanthes scabra]|uniref:F-box domain-containing protein n=1 Tax=Stylosanthes scabra TaxID=79078 RepID=A0ABU6XEX2_9FABA|nr:hypothetical protein [Stylosanthes scabra]